jgi:alpha,alpha-trehalase
MSSTRWLTFPLLVALALALGTLAVSAQNVTSTGSQSFSATPVSTTVPSPTGSLDAPIPGQGQYPALQRECATTTVDTWSLATGLT